MWRSLQVVRKQRLLARLHEGRPIEVVASSHVLNSLQVAGHVEDEHMCSALVHMCSMV
jgi:hypothetical protein